MSAGCRTATISNKAISFLCSVVIAASLATSAVAQDALFQSRQVTPSGEYTFGIEGPAVDAQGNLYVVNFGRPGTIGKLAAGAGMQSNCSPPFYTRKASVDLDPRQTAAAACWSPDCKLQHPAGQWTARISLPISRSGGFNLMANDMAECSRRHHPLPAIPTGERMTVGQHHQNP